MTETAGATCPSCTSMLPAAGAPCPRCAPAPWGGPSSGPHAVPFQQGPFQQGHPSGSWPQGSYQPGPFSSAPFAQGPAPQGPLAPGGYSPTPFPPSPFGQSPYPAGPGVGRSPKSAGIAVLLTFLWIGAGHLYLDRMGMGLTLMGVHFVVGFFLAVVFFPLAFLFWLAAFIGCAIWVSNLAGQINAGTVPPRSTW